MLNTKPLGGFPEGTAVDGWALIQSARFLTSNKSGKKYLRWEGLDAQGSPVRGTLFPPQNDPTFKFEKFAPEDVVSIKATIGEGRLGPDIWATSITKITDEKDIDAFKGICYPCVPQEELQKYISELEAYAISISDNDLRALSFTLFHEYFFEHLPSAPAAKTNHEPIRGGLAKHTWEVVTIVNSQLLLDKGLNRDVLLFSAVFHDIGKIREYTSSMTWTETGRLISHIATAIEMITTVLITKSLNVSPSLLTQVKHCVLSHHGEVGDIQPTTREAVVLHFADHMMSRLGHIDEMIRRGDVGHDGWGKFSSWLQTAPYIPAMDDRIKKE